MIYKGFNSRRFLLFAGVMLTLLHVGSVTAWGAKDAQGIAQVSDRGQRGIPPKAAKGISPERVEVISSLNPHKATSYDVYLDRFEIWTEDTLAVINALENPEYVKGVKRSYGGSWQISVNTGNPRTGKLLRDKLKKLPVVDRLENHLYIPDYEVAPSDMYYATLYNPSDSVQFKELADSLGLRPENWVYNNARWLLYTKPGNKRSYQDIIHSILQSGLVENCSVAMDYYSSMQAFSYDPYIDKQWGLYNRNNITIYKKNRYTDLNVSLAWNYATAPRNSASTSSRPQSSPTLGCDPAQTRKPSISFGEGDCLSSAERDCGANEVSTHPLMQIPS